MVGERVPFEGYTIILGRPVGPAGKGQSPHAIMRPDGTKLGVAWSMPGAKRMVRKDAGTNLCECGHIPSGHMSWRDDAGRQHGGCAHYDGPGDRRVRCSCNRTRSQATACVGQGAGATLLPPIKVGAKPPSA